MLGTYNVAIDPATGLPKSEIQKMKRQAMESRLNKAETLAHLLSQELQTETGRLLVQAIFEKVVHRLETLMAQDTEISTLFSLLDALNVKINITPKVVREEIEQRLPHVT